MSTGSKSTRSPGNATAPSQAAGSVVQHYPWVGLDDKKPRENFNIRFTDAEKAMLKFIEENGRESMHAFCKSVLRPALRDKVEEITGRKLVDE